MQIPQNVIAMLSAKGKGYVEAAVKLAEGQRLVEEATIEIAALDGKKINAKKEKVFQNAGGKIVTDGVRDLARPKMTPEYLKSFLKRGPLSSREVSQRAGCSLEHARRVLTEASGVHVVGNGNRVQWSLTPEKGKIVRKKSVANKTTRKLKPKTRRVNKGKDGLSKTARKQGECEALNPEQQKADEAKILEVLKEKPGMSIGPLMKKLKRSFYPVTRAIKSLIAAGKLKPIKVEIDNGRKISSWEPV